ncbi:hypothetical protein LTR74_016980 [Friedmanniomyces endolithicus]|nr:hypothetical protein LTR74_016980 [Friedmanniomyces endolithicus]
MAHNEKLTKGSLANGDSGSGRDVVEELEYAEPRYGQQGVSKEVSGVNEEDDPNVHQHIDFRLFVSLVAMSFLWVGSQIPLYLYGSVLPLIYSEIGGANGRYVWMVIGYLIPNAALCPFVGALSDMFGRRLVAVAGQMLLILGPVVVSTAHSINVAIGGMVLAGLGAGLNELIALAGTSELVPVRKRSAYVGGIVATILPFCPSAVWAQLIARESNWRWVGLLVGLWNFVGLVLVLLFYKDPVRNTPVRPKKEILSELDYIGAILSIGGALCFMMVLLAKRACFGAIHHRPLHGDRLFFWEGLYAKQPIAPWKMFSKDARTMVLILVITFFSGGNFFVLLLFWPTQAYNMYGVNPVAIGIRTLPIGFGIIGGATIALVFIGITRGRTTSLMIFWCTLMTAFTGAMSVATTQNLYPTVYPILLFASIGVGAVIIPCSIIAQIVCPTELIGTITAITLSVRYIGGAVGFTAYYNVFFHKFQLYAQSVGVTIIEEGIVAPTNLKVVEELVVLAGQARYQLLKELIATSPDIGMKATAFDKIIAATQEAYAYAYRWPYWISIAFGGICLLCSFGLRDVRRFM